MKININTKIDDLLNKYNFLEDILIEKYPRFKKLKNCHPQSSLHIVEKILAEFKNGTKNEASFWITTKSEKFIYIQYIAIHDDKGNYKGCLEVSQDITDIKKLQGEQRLLNWE